MQWHFEQDLPIYTQLVHQIKLRIVTGVYAPGERLPPVRELSAQAGVNPNTMQRAMAELEREQLVYSQRTSGRFVMEDTERIDVVKQELAREQIDRFLTAMRQLGYRDAEIVALLQAPAAEEG